MIMRRKDTEPKKACDVKSVCESNSVIDNEDYQNDDNIIDDK